MKRLWIIVFILVLSLLVAACTGAAPAADAPSDDAAAAESATVRVWTHQNDSFNEGLEQLAEQYMADNEGVEITFETFDYDTYIQTLQTALPAGNEADILQMFGTWTCSYAEGGNLATVPEEVISLSDAEAQLFEAPLAGYVCDGTLYGLPQEFNIEYGAALVNTAMAEEAGLGDLSAGWEDWTAFIADAQAMTDSQDGIITRAGYNFTSGDAIPFAFYSLIRQAGGDFFDETNNQFTINTPEGEQALELMVSLVEAGVVDPVLFNDESNWVGDCHFEELCAMGLVGPWIVAEYSGDFPEVAASTIYVPLPKLDGNGTFVADSGWGLTVSNNSQVQDAGWDFISFVALNEPNALGWNIGSGTLPAIRANTEGDARATLVGEFAHFEPFLDILGDGEYIGSLPDRDLLWYDITYPHVLNVLQGGESIPEALEAIEREANESLN